MPTFRIHPALGVARVGNAPGFGFLAPEAPGIPANWDLATGAFLPFKENGLIKRQGVRFRICEYDDNGAVVREVLPGEGNIRDVEWTVHVANRKATFFQFDSIGGEDGDFSGNGARNESVTGAARIALEIDPGPKSISGRSAQPVVLSNANPTTNRKIADLGELVTDESGRLVFWGGHGNTLQLKSAPNIDNYVNNDGWLDDVCDGPVSAVIRFQDGSEVQPLGAWVTVGPPDFAPALANVVSLYETIWDVFVRNPQLPIPNLEMYKTNGSLAGLAEQRRDWDATTNRFKTYSPSFVNDIAYLFERAFGAMFLHDPPDLKKPFHNPIGPQMWSDFADPNPLHDVLRAHVFARMRDPDEKGRADSRKMPRGLGDEYCDENEDPPGSPASMNSRRFFSLTRTQYALLAQWANRQFRSDGVSSPPKPTALPPLTPDGLDRAALEGCVGGPFYPGIEVSWMIRNPKIYLEPFRLKLGVIVGAGDPAVGIPDVTVGPGFLTQQMALPWQADFRDCKREPITNTATGAEAFAMWWAGQRPDDVFANDEPDKQVPWTRPPHFKATDGSRKRYNEMVAKWFTLGFVSRQDPRDKRRWLETERS